MKKTIFSLFAILVVVGSVALPVLAQEAVQPSIRIVPHAEIGFLAVLNHVYRSGEESNGNRQFDYVRQGGQDNLFPSARFSVDAVLGGQHRLSFLYQPLTLVTKTVSQRNGTDPVQIAGVAFAPNTPLDVTYGFDFFRLSYLYDFLPQIESELGIGISFQLRNANIVFSSGDGTQRVVQNNIGLVPIIKIKAAHWFSSEFGLDLEADGFYASSAIFNGSGKPFEGWIWDAALRAKTRLAPGAVIYLSLRSIGGGALGTNAYDSLFATSSIPGESTYNALSTLIPAIGVSLE